MNGAAAVCSRVTKKSQHIRKPLRPYVPQLLMWRALWQGLGLRVWGRQEEAPQERQQAQGCGRQLSIAAVLLICLQPAKQSTRKTTADFLFLFIALVKGSSALVSWSCEARLYTWKNTDRRLLERPGNRWFPQAWIWVASFVFRTVGIERETRHKILGWF